MKKHCNEIVSNFAPFGVEKLGSMYFQSIVKETCLQYKPVKITNLDLDHNLPTVVLVGTTQAGKSFFGNMLLGVQNPGLCYVNETAGRTVKNIPSDCKFISGQIDQKICKSQKNVWQKIGEEIKKEYNFKGYHLQNFAE